MRSTVRQPETRMFCCSRCALQARDAHASLREVLDSGPTLAASARGPMIRKKNLTTLCCATKMGVAFVTCVKRGRWHRIPVHKLRSILMRAFLCAHSYPAQRYGFSRADVCSGTSEADEAKKSWRAVGLPLRQSLISLNYSWLMGWGSLRRSVAPQATRK